MTKAEYKKLKQEAWQDFVRKLVFSANMAYLGGLRWTGRA